MKIERSKNAVRNISFQIPLNIYNMILPFIVRTVFIRIMGIEYLGLNSLFTSILSVLNLAELGVGSAMVFSMYKAIADDDKTSICALMKLYKIYYRIIGLVILIIGLLITPFIPNLINGDIPSDLNIYILYLMNLGVTVISYWLFAYKNCLLSAHQRTDINSKISFFIITITNIFQLLIIFLTKNYYFYILVSMIMGAVSNITTALIVDKMFPEYHAKGTLPKYQIKEINKRVRDLFTSKIGTVIVNSTDSIVISAFLGLKILAQYNNYYYIMTTIFGFISIIFSACSAGIGNSLITETEEKNFRDLEKFLLLLSWIGCFCTCCFACLYQPFIELWVGRDNMLSFSYVIVFCIYFYTKIINTLLNQYKDSAGIWHSDRFRPFVTAISNLLMNLIMVKFWGLYGILLSTIFSMLFVGMPWLFHNLFSEVFDKKHSKKFLVKTLMFIIATIIITFICIVISHSLFNFDSLILVLICRGILCLVVPNILYFIFFHKLNEFTQLVRMIDVLTKGKIKFLKNFLK